MTKQIDFFNIFPSLIIENKIFNNKYKYSGINQNGLTFKNIMNIYIVKKEGIICLIFILEIFFTNTKGL